MEIKWDNECKRCGTGCTHDYCHDCQMLGHDPSLSNYRELKPTSSINIRRQNINCTGIVLK